MWSDSRQLQYCNRRLLQITTDVWMIKLTVSKFIQVVYGYGQSSICGGSRGSDHCACATGSDVTGHDRKWRHRKRNWPEVTEFIACACVDFPPRFSPFFSYYSSSTKCWYMWSRMGSLGCAHALPGFPPFFGCFRIYCVVLHVRLFTVWYF